MRKEPGGRPSRTGAIPTAAAMVAAAVTLVALGGSATPPPGPATDGHQGASAHLASPARLRGAAPSGTGAGAAGGAGNTWTLLGRPGGRVTSVSCATAHVCEIAGRAPASEAPYAAASTDGGTTWRLQPLPAPMSAANAISCPTAGHCVIAGVGIWSWEGAVAATADGGMTWSVDSSLGVGELDAIDCPSVNACFAGGNTAHAMWFSSDGGFTWSPQNFSATAPYGEVTGISCPSAASCVAVGWNYGAASSGELVGVAARTADGGATWTAGILPAPLASALAVGCLSESTCVVTGATPPAVPAAEITADAGLRWIPTSLPPTNAADLDSITCLPGRGCIAGGADQREQLSALVGIAVPPATGGAPSPLGAIPRRGTSPGGPVRTVNAIGDSDAYSETVGALAGGNSAGIRLNMDPLVGCGVVTGNYLRQGAPGPPLTWLCANWQRIYQRDVSLQHPDVSILVLGRWETMTHMIGSTPEWLGQSAYDRVVLSGLLQAIGILASHGGRVLLATSPYFLNGLQPDGHLWPEDQPARVDMLNRLMDEAVAESHGVARIIDLGGVLSPGHTYTRVVDGIPLRSDDGTHDTTLGSIRLGVWLLARLRSSAPVPQPPP